MADNILLSNLSVPAFPSPLCYTFNKNQGGTNTMEVRNRVTVDYCRYRKKLDEKSLKAYRIDLRQFVKAWNRKEKE